jgi:hypothetical protein
VTTEIQPGQNVAVFALPMPVSSFAHLADVVERLYGTGETMLTMDGDAIRITAPKEGFGPIPRGPLPELPTAVEEDGRLIDAYTEDGGLRVTMEEAEHVVLAISDAVRLWFDQVGGINYVQMRFMDPVRDAEFTYIVQRDDKPTAHDLRVVAETELATARAEIARLTAELAATTGASA